MHAAETKHAREQVRLYEGFCSWIALGKWRSAVGEGAGSVHRAQSESATKLAGALEVYDGLPLIFDGPEDAAPSDSDIRGASALLFALSAVAWELVVREQNPNAPEQDEQVIERSALLCALGNRGVVLDDTSALDCMLLSAHGGSGSGAQSFLFGHRSFIEHLAFRYHVAEFNRLARNEVASFDDRAQEVRDSVSAASLLAVSDDTATFVDGSLGLPQLHRESAQRLHDWCIREVDDDRLTFGSDSAPTLNGETRRLLRWSSFRVAGATFVAESEAARWRPDPLVASLLFRTAPAISRACTRGGGKERGPPRRGPP